MKKFIFYWIAFITICATSSSFSSFSTNYSIETRSNSIIKVAAINQINLNESVKDKLAGSQVLVYTKNGKGYVHDNIASAVNCIQNLGKQNNFKVDVSDDPNLADTFLIVQ